MKVNHYPTLERKPGGPDNWVEKVGGLPKYINLVASHLHYVEGFTISHAIATAVNTVKRWARKGQVVKYNDPRNNHVTVITAAMAAKDVAEWEAKLASVRGTRSARVSRRGLKLSEAQVDAVAKRAGKIKDPAARAAARSQVLDLAVSTAKRKQSAKKGNTIPGTQSFPIDTVQDLRKAVFAYGRAKDKAAARKHIIRRARALNATKMLPNGWAKGLNMSTDRLDRHIDLALTKDGRKSFKRQGKWGHGFVPLDKKAKEAKAKGSPIAARRIQRLFGGKHIVVPTSTKGRPGKPSKTINITTGGKNRTAENVLTAGQTRRTQIKDTKATQRVAESKLESSKKRRTRRSDQAWDKIDDSQKTVRNGKRYTLTTYHGKTQLTEWFGPNSHVQAAPDVNKRRLASLRAVDAQALTTAQIRRMLKVPGQPKNVKKVLNKVLAQKVAAEHAAHGKKAS